MSPVDSSRRYGIDSKKMLTALIFFVSVCRRRAMRRSSVERERDQTLKPTRDAGARRRDATRLEAVREVPAVGQVQTHDAIVRFEQPGVDLEVRGRARQRLHVDAPLLRVEMKRRERALLTERLALRVDSRRGGRRSLIEGASEAESKGVDIACRD